MLGHFNAFASEGADSADAAGTVPLHGFASEGADSAVFVLIVTDSLHVWTCKRIVSGFGGPPPVLQRSRMKQHPTDGIIDMAIHD